MENLKIFNTENEYNSYITGSSAVIPNVSIVGNDSNVEYNPEKMFIITGKKTLLPNIIKVPFIVNTITNGKVNVWFRPSTGSTYTKLNVNDITFSGGNLQNKIKDYTSVNAQLPSTGYNNVYIISGVSTTDSSIKDSVECIQYGSIVLDSTTFIASGESKTVQLKTAIGNEWKITGIPNWLSFSTTAGTGPTLITITASTYEDTTADRTADITVTYTKKQLKNYGSVTTFTQESAEAKYMYLISEGQTTASTSSLSSAGTSSSIGVVTNLSQADINNMVTTAVSDSWISNVSVTPSSVSFNVSSRSLAWNGSSRTGTITIYGGGSGNLTITVNQAANETYYVTFTSPVTISSGAVNDSVVTCTTNCPFSVLQTLTSTTTQNWVSDVKASSVTQFTFDAAGNASTSTRACTVNIYNGATQVASFTVNQQGAEEKYFRFNSTGTDTITGNYAASSAPAQTMAYTTNYTNLSVTSSTAWITCSLTGSSVQVSVSNNLVIEGRTGYVYVKSGDITIGTITVNQSAATAYLTFSDGTTAPKSVTVGSAITSNYFDISTNIPSAQLNISGNGMLTSETISGSRITLTFAANTTTSNRTGTCSVSYGSLSLSYQVTQSAIAYLTFTGGATTASTSSLSSAGTSSSVAIITNLSQSDINNRVTTSVSDSWISNVSVSTTGVTFTVATRSLAWDSSSRTGTITISGGGSGNLTLTVNQAANATYFIQFFSPYEISSGAVNDYVVSKYTNCPVDVLQSLLILVSDTWVSDVKVSNVGTISFDATQNTSTSQRSCTVTFYNGATAVASFDVIQQGAEAKYFRFNSTGTNTISDSFSPTGNLPVVYLYTTNYSDLSASSSTNWISASLTNNGIEVGISNNTSIEGRTGYAYVKSNNVVIGTVEVYQSAATAYLTFSDGTTSAKFETVSSAATSTYFDILTNIPSAQLTLTNNTIVTGSSISGGRVTLTFPSNSSSSSDRTGSCIVSYNGLSLTYNIIQKAIPYLTFTDGTTGSRNVTVGSAATNTSFAILTNITDNSLVTGKTGIVLGVTVDANHTQVTGSFNATQVSTGNTYGSFSVSYGSSALTMNVTQNPRTYLMFSNGASARSFNVSSASSSTQAALIDTNYTSNSQLSISSNKTWLTGTINTSGIDYSYTTNPAGSAARTGILTASGVNGEVITLTINQASGASASRQVTVEFPDVINVEIRDIGPAQEGTSAVISIDGMYWTCDNLQQGMVEFVNSDIHQSEINVTTASTAYTFNFSFESDNGGGGSVNGQGWLSEINVGFVPEGGTGEQPFTVNIPAGESAITLYQLSPNVVITYE